MSAKRIAAAFVFGVLVASAPSVWAQSAIAGIVRDSSGAVLPGVTVEAASNVLIEKVRSAITDGEGQYRIIDLRPGIYAITFTLPGFTTFRQDKFELPTSFTATVNAEMRVGELEETLTVTGESPTVDTHTATTTQVVAREVWETLPSARNVQAVAQMMTGVRMNLSDVGGSQAMQQQQFLVRGVSGGNNTVSFDGLNLNSLLGDGATVPYFNDATVQEFSFQAGALDADTTAGGGRLNVIPKDGGNRFSGSGFGAYNGESWQSNNFTQELLDAGLESGGAIVGMYDVNGSLGGPIVRDKLWFMFAARQYAVDNKIPGVDVIDDQYIKLAALRLTWQITPSNKMSVHHDRMYKWRHHRNDPPQALADAEALAHSRQPDLLLGRGEMDVDHRSAAAGRGRPDPLRPAEHDGLPARRPAGPLHARLVRRTSRGSIAISAPSAGRRRPRPQHARALQLAGRRCRTSPARITSRSEATGPGAASGPFPSRSPISSRNTGPAFPTPSWFATRRSLRGRQDDRRRGLFAQDSWTHKRLTVTGGLRFEYFDARIPEQSSPAGRFVGERQFAAIEHLPQFTNLVPRLSAVYDLFGNGKTAIKANFSKYVDQRTLSLTTPYSPLAAVSARVRVARSQPGRHRPGRAGLCVSHPRLRNPAVGTAAELRHPRAQHPGS